MKMPRILHKFYAFIFGYFWKECPFCGKYFGGHEESGTKLTSWGSGIGTCKNCKDLANQHNKEFLIKFKEIDND